MVFNLSHSFPFLFAVFLFFTASTAREYQDPQSRFFLGNLKAPHFSLDNPVNPKLFGKVRHVIAKPKELAAYVHPRVVTSSREWDVLVSRYADSNFFNKPGTWSRAFLILTRAKGPESPFIRRLADLERTRATAAFTGRHRSDFSNVDDFETYRKSLSELALVIKESNEERSHSLLLCALWAFVSEKEAAKGFFGQDIMSKCIDATVAWAKVLLAHRTFHCSSECNVTWNDPERAYLWNYNLTWSVPHDWYLIGSNLALAYDVLYSRMNAAQQTVVRSAISLLVLRRYSWGLADTTTVRNPNAETHPHRIFSNWAAYHSNLYLTNLAIEGETGFISYTQKELNQHQAHGFNHKMNRKFEAVFEGYMQHSVYPDGSTFEDGYTYHFALREGSLGLLASHKRGHNHLDTPRFRNLIHNVAQMKEPWTCGHIVGHASGGGLFYPAYAGLFRYAYPNGALPQMLWAHRFGKNFLNTRNCRTWYIQTMTQLAFLGGEHNNLEESYADSVESLKPSLKSMFPLSYVSTRRGLIISRSSHAQKSSYMHFDARPDSMLAGHDNADRGVITFAALKRRWFDDLPWKHNRESRRHSLMHVDGLAQAMKAPSVTILKAEDTPDYFIAAADLSYTSNVQWAPGWQDVDVGTGTIKEFNEDGSFVWKTYTFKDKEPNSPWELGWPMEDSANDIGFYRGMKLNPQQDIGFCGTNMWRRHYREQDLDYNVRSTIMVRSKQSNVGFGVLVDSVGAGPGKHTFESYLILNTDVSPSERPLCDKNICKITLKTPGEERLDVHVVTRGKNLSYRLETFEGNRKSYTRLVLKTSGLQSEEFWMAFHPHMGDPNRFEMSRQENDAMMFLYEGEKMWFDVSPTDHAVAHAAEGRYGKWATDPMEPIELVPKVFHQVTYPELEAIDERSFFEETDFRYQVVFKITSRRKARRADRFTTCGGRRFTNAETRVSIFSCGNGAEGYQNYKQRKCNFVDESDPADGCSGRSGSFKANLRSNLKVGNDYYLVVHVSPLVSPEPHFRIAHKFYRIN